LNTKLHTTKQKTTKIVEPLLDSKALADALTNFLKMTNNVSKIIITVAFKEYSVFAAQ